MGLMQAMRAAADSLGYAVIGLGVLFMLVGVLGLFQRGKDFYYRLLVACKIDTVGLLTISLGLALRHGFSFFTGKTLLITVIILVLNPFVAHVIGQAAYRSGYRSVGEDGEAEGGRGQ